jgi:hypothetical protein
VAASSAASLGFASPRRGHPRLALHRLGQQAFQGVVLDAYGQRCAITGPEPEFLEWHLDTVYKAA